MEQINDGGPAFPVLDMGSTRTDGYGMTMRDYFAAHAPAEPQTWFHPSMPAAPESLYLDKKTMDEAERNEYEYFHEFFPHVKFEELKTPLMIEYAPKAVAADTALSEWRVEHEKQRQIQWPYAWADAMLAARSPSAS